MNDETATVPCEYTPEDEARDDAEIAVDLIRDGWKSVSNKYHTIARLPFGKTGLETLQESAPDEFKRIMALAEQQAANTYLRMYATERAGTSQQLDSSMFQAFKRAGGEASW